MQCEAKTPVARKPRYAPHNNSVENRLKQVDEAGRWAMLYAGVCSPALLPRVTRVQDHGTLQKMLADQQMVASTMEQYHKE